MAGPTLRQVADRAEVSIATASLVLSGKSQTRVAAKTEARVIAAADKLGYRTNRLARSLRQQSTKVLGLLSIEVATTPYAGSMLKAAQVEARASDYDLLFHEISNDPSEISEGLELFAEHQVDGIIIASYFHQILELPDKLPENLVLLDAASLRNVDSVVPDEEKGVQQLMELLHQQGHKNVGYIGDSAPFPAARIRKKTFLNSAKKYGWIQAENAIALRPHTDTPDGYSAMDELWTKRPDLTAIFCFTDRMAFGAYERARELGLRIPQDLSVVGYDDQTLISGALRPGLTTVALPHEAMGAWAVRRLIDRCKASEPMEYQQLAIPGELVQRESISTPRSINAG